MAAAAGLLWRKGAAHAGEDTTVHERDRGGSRDEGGVVATELYDGVHGGRGEREAGSERGDGEAREEARAARARGYGGAGCEAARGTELGRVSAMAGHALVHGCHDAFLSNTWRARWSPTWSPFLAYSVHIQTCSTLDALQT